MWTVRAAPSSSGAKADGIVEELRLANFRLREMSHTDELTEVGNRRNFDLRLKEEISNLAVSFSDYHGGASIGSFICRRAGEQEMELVGLYSLVPTYDFSNLSQLGNAIRIENDFMAWLGLMRRVNYMFKTHFALTDLEQKSKRLVELVASKVEELDSMAPQLGVRDYLTRLSEDFVEVTFDPLDDVWEDELRRLFDDSESLED